jgi:hypothetical protein
MANSGSDARTIVAPQGLMTINAYLVPDITNRKLARNPIWQYNDGLKEVIKTVLRGDLLFTFDDLIKQNPMSSTGHPEESKLVPVTNCFNGYGSRLLNQNIFAGIELFMRIIVFKGASPRDYDAGHNGMITIGTHGHVTTVNGPKTALAGKLAIARAPAPDEIIGDTREQAKYGMIKPIIEPLESASMYPLVKDLCMIEEKDVLSSITSYDGRNVAYLQELEDTNAAIMDIIFIASLLLKNTKLIDQLSKVNMADGESIKAFYRTLTKKGDGTFRRNFFETLKDTESVRKFILLDKMAQDKTYELLESKCEIGIIQGLMDPMIQFTNVMLSRVVGRFATSAEPFTPVDLAVNI